MRGGYHKVKIEIVIRQGVDCFKFSFKRKIYESFRFKCKPKPLILSEI